jgi:peroxisomal 3,2-trans-enoyl-CoA isomerase
MSAPSAPQKRITVATKDGVMLLTFNRPKVGNALDAQTFVEWQAALKAAESDNSVQVVVVTGSGPYFSTGADVRSIAGADFEGLEKILREGSGKTTTMMIDFPKLIVAAVNGPVVGYPAGLLGVFDIVYVSTKASYSMPFLHLGIGPEGCSSVTLPAAAGTSVANDVLVTNRRLSADEMVRVGIAARMFDSAGFIDTVVAEVTKAVKGAAPSSVVNSKRLIRDAFRVRLHEANEAETANVIAQFKSGVAIKRFMAVARGLAKKQDQDGAAKSKL